MHYRDRARSLSPVGDISESVLPQPDGGVAVRPPSLRSVRSSPELTVHGGQADHLLSATSKARPPQLLAKPQQRQQNQPPLPHQHQHQQQQQPPLPPPPSPPTSPPAAAPHIAPQRQAISGSDVRNTGFALPGPLTTPPAPRTHAGDRHAREGSPSQSHHPRPDHSRPDPASDTQLTDQSSHTSKGGPQLLTKTQPSF